MRLPRTLRRPRGVTLVEIIVSMAVLTIGMLGLAHMQVVAVRQNQMAANMAIASSLGRDMAESISMWRYNDPRLQPIATIQNLSDTRIAKRFDLPRDEDLASLSEYKMQFGEIAGDTSATNAGAIGEYDGAGPDVKEKGKNFFRRYWNVFGWDPDGDSIPNAKFVVVVVRWREPGLGMRQVYTTAIKANEEVYSL